MQNLQREVDQPPAGFPIKFHLLLAERERREITETCQKPKRAGDQHEADASPKMRRGIEYPIDAHLRKPALLKKKTSAARTIDSRCPSPAKGHFPMKLMCPAEWIIVLGVTKKTSPSAHQTHHVHLAHFHRDDISAVRCSEAARIVHRHAE